MSLRYQHCFWFVYRQLSKAVFFIVKKFFRKNSKVLDLHQAQSFSGGLWFHVSSAGELESLWPLIEAYFSPEGRENREDKKEVSPRIAYVTIFSPSAEWSLKKRIEELRKNPRFQYGFDVLKDQIFIGFSPWEGHWYQFLSRIKPQAMLTVKYEAWPECWSALSQLQIPLGILSAKKRSSFVWVQRILKLSCTPLPKLLLSIDHSRHREKLKELFGLRDRDIQLAADPRWLQVFKSQSEVLDITAASEHRSSVKTKRFFEVIETYKYYPRPWLVLGSIYAEDLVLWSLVVNQNRDFKGTLWIVPHRIDHESIATLFSNKVKMAKPWNFKSMEWTQSSPKFLQTEFAQTQGTDDSSQHDHQSFKTIVVNEMGLLSQLYIVSDFAYVGGGFNQGVHSTIEPGMAGIPIACGYYRHDLFDEIALLNELGQLTLIKDEKELAQWFLKYRSFALEEGSVLKNTWKECHLERISQLNEFCLSFIKDVQQKKIEV